ncbi:MAG: phosphonopyruvate decarboxylase [Pseudomonadota bacterium]
MIDPGQFVALAAQHGFGWYAGVPCSLLGPLIDMLGAEPARHAVAANEGDAVAAAAGAWLGGRGGVAYMQNSGLGNAVSPLTSLNAVFRIPALLLVTLRGEAGQPDEPQHAFMGRITRDLLTTMEIAWEVMPDSAAALAAAFGRARDAMRASERPYALLVRRDSFAPAPAVRAPTLHWAPASPIAARQWPAARRPTRRRALERIAALTPERGWAVVASTGYIGRELYAVGDRPNHFYMVGSMGCASSLGLGLALARPDLRVLVVDGDGALLMRLGSLAGVGACRPRNLVHVVIDNEMHESTGGQSTASAAVCLGAVAAACGYASVWTGDQLSLLDHALATAEGPIFAHVKIEPGVGGGLPRPALSPVEVRQRFMAHLAGAAPVARRNGDGVPA